jgi:hypothetical protein
MTFTLTTPYIINSLSSDVGTLEINLAGGGWGSDSEFTFFQTYNVDMDLGRNKTVKIFDDLGTGDSFTVTNENGDVLFFGGPFAVGGFDGRVTGRHVYLNVDIYKQTLIPAFTDGGGTVPQPPGSIYYSLIQAYSLPAPTEHVTIDITPPPLPHYWTVDGLEFRQGETVGEKEYSGLIDVVSGNGDGLVVSARFQWQRSADHGATWQDIASATDVTYTLAKADIGDVVRLEAFFVDDFGNQQFAVSQDSGVVLADNYSPSAIPHVFTESYGKAVSVSTADLLAGATDPDGDALSVLAVKNAQHGTVTFDSKGNAIFAAAVGYDGAGAGFDYIISDGNGGTSTAHVSIGITGNAPAYIYNAPHSGTEMVDFTGDGARHQFVAGSGDTTVTTGSGGSSIALGAGISTVHGGSGKDAITFGPGLAQVIGGTGGTNSFTFVKGQVYVGPGDGQYDTITDFHDAPSGWSNDHDMIYLKGFSKSATIAYEGDLSGLGGQHLYRIDDGGYHAEFVLDYVGTGHNLAKGQWGFL